MASILVPVLYVLIVFGGLFLFSTLYRKRLACTHPRLTHLKPQRS
jgi:hypothetical protein